MLAGEILQPQQVTFEITLVMKVNVETAKIGILRQQIFGRRVSGIGKEGARIHSAPDPNQFLHKLNYPPCTEPARHCAGDLVADEITKNCRMAGVFTHRSTNSFSDLPANRSFAEELDMFFPGKGHQNAHSCVDAAIRSEERRVG